MIINLTPHAVILNGQSFPPSGSLARVSTRNEAAGSHDGIPLVTVESGPVEGLPEPAEGVLYVVSAMVRGAVPHRSDVASPGDLLRDAAGVVQGAKNLIINKNGDK